jgi:hypothetical protein
MLVSGPKLRLPAHLFGIFRDIVESECDGYGEEIIDRLNGVIQ